MRPVEYRPQVLKIAYKYLSNFIGSDHSWMFFVLSSFFILYLQTHLYFLDVQVQLIYPLLEESDQERGK